MRRQEDTIPLEECIDRHIYKLRSRNLSLGVFNTHRKGFIGIRQKFESRYLFTEFYYDLGNFGTAYPIKDFGLLPDNRILLKENYPSCCFWCGYPIKKGTNEGIWKHLIEGTCEEKVRAMGGFNYSPLFNFLEDFDEEEEAKKTLPNSP